MRISDWSSDVCSSDLFERLETALLRRALEVAGALEIDAAEERAETVEKMTVEQAIGLLNMHRRSVREGQAARRTPAARHIATQEETDAVLLKRIAMVKRQRARRAAIDADRQSVVEGQRVSVRVYLGW